MANKFQDTIRLEFSHFQIHSHYELGNLFKESDVGFSWSEGVGRASVLLAGITCYLIP